MKRIIWHWTAGGHRANVVDRKHYHFIIDGNGVVVEGDHRPEANLDVYDGAYAAHTRHCNTGAIGIAVAGMHGARERPFDPGRSPLKQAQIEALTDLTAELCRKYSIPVTRRTVLSHMEVERTLGIPQPGKWDISWLPGMKEPGDPVLIGDALRSNVERKMRGERAKKPGMIRPETAEKATPWAVAIAFIVMVAGAIFGLGG